MIYVTTISCGIEHDDHPPAVALITEGVADMGDVLDRQASKFLERNGPKDCSCGQPAEVIGVWGTPYTTTGEAERELKGRFGEHTLIEDITRGKIVYASKGQTANLRVHLGHVVCVRKHLVGTLLLPVPVNAPQEAVELAARRKMTGLFEPSGRQVCRHCLAAGEASPEAERLLINAKTFSSLEEAKQYVDGLKDAGELKAFEGSSTLLLEAQFL